MPITFLRYFYIGAALRWLMSAAVWPKAAEFRAMMTAFKDAVMSTRRATGVHASDFTPFGESPEEEKYNAPAYDEKKEEKLPQKVYEALLRILSSSNVRFASIYERYQGDAPLLHDRVHFIRSLTRKGMKFATRQAGLRDSFVLFRDPTNDDASLRAGQISDIFLHSRTAGGKVVVEPYLLINEYRALTPTHSSLDPYRQFPDLNTHLYYDDFHTEKRLVRFEDVQCHAAVLFCSINGIDGGCVVFRSLDRVSLPKSLDIVSRATHIYRQD